MLDVFKEVDVLNSMLKKSMPDIRAECLSMIMIWLIIAAELSARCSMYTPFWMLRFLSMR